MAPNQKLMLTSLWKVFKYHGEFCASQPWEVIVATITILVCVMTVFNRNFTHLLPFQHGFIQEEEVCMIDPKGSETVDWNGQYHALEVILVSIFRCLGIIHCLYRFRQIHRIGSSLIMKIAASYLALIFVIYSLVVMSFKAPDINTLVDSYFLILLLLDMSKVTCMAQFALSSLHQLRISENLAHSMFLLAPTLVLDTMATTLLMSTGLLTGFQRLELLSHYAIIYQVANFLIYITFYPAGLSLILELMYTSDGRPGWDVRQIVVTLPKDNNQSPVVHRVRVVGTLLLIVLHVICRWPLSFASSSSDMTFFCSPALYFIERNFIQLAMIVAVIVICIKFLMNNKDWEDDFPFSTVNQDVQKINIEKAAREIEEDQSTSSTDEGISVSQHTLRSSLTERSSPKHRRKAHLYIRGNGGSDESSSESAWSEINGPDVKHQEAQTSRDLFHESVPKSIKFAEKTSLKKDTCNAEPETEDVSNDLIRPLEECVRLSKQDGGYSFLTNDEIVQLVESKHIRSHALEAVLGNHLRSVEVRRKCISRATNNISTGNYMAKLPYKDFDYEIVRGACAESVIGYMTMPLGVVGPLMLDGNEYTVPMATTEGCLIASTNRGCSALRVQGVTSCLINDGMSRAPVIRFSSITRAAEAKYWISDPVNFQELKKEFDSTSRFARLKNIDVHLAGRSIYLRFVATTGDAMGMNMLSKGTEHALTSLKEVFPDMEILSLSGNLCTDKKPAAINWIKGRGKYVTCEAIVPAFIVESVLKTTTAALCDLNIAKNLTGSAMAGSIGGFNAHAANIVTAIFIATGQDTAQNVGSSNCITLMEPWGESGRDLYVTVTMPSIEVGTVGGGTILSAQSSCLEMLGVKGSHPTDPGSNAKKLARIICATVLAGELSLMSALAAGHLVKSHLRHNRSTANFVATSTPPLVSTSTY